MIDTQLAPSCTISDRDFLESLGWISPAVIDAVLSAPANHLLPQCQKLRERWLLYAALQFISAAQRRSTVQRAFEERLDAFILAVEQGEIPDNLPDAGTWLRNLPGNRAKKHLHRDRLLRKHATDLHRPEPISPVAAAEQSDAIENLRSRTTDSEWILLTRAASGGVTVLAQSLGVAIGTVKSSLSRCRARLRRAS